MSRPPDDTGRRLTAFALRGAVPMNLVFVALVLIGVTVIARMPVDVYPDVALDIATIETLWLGASAEDVERLVTDRIEDQIQDIRGVAWIKSDSKPDLSRIRVKFRETLAASEFDASFRQLRAAVDQVTDLPDGAERPRVTKISVAEVFFLVWIVIEDVGGVGEHVLNNIAYRLKPVLREVPGVAKVDTKLIRNREIHILADRDALRQYGLTLPGLSEILLQYNRNLPSGTLPQGDRELSVRAAGGVTDPDQLGSIVIGKDPAGGHVYLRDVATIRPGFERKTIFPRYNLHPAISMGVAKTDDADSRIVAARIRQALAAFEPRLPRGVALRVADDASDIIKSRLDVLGSNLAWGVALVFLVLWVAVGARNAVLAIVGIPFSFLCALIFMHLLGVTINAVSLIGLVLCSGMIVDDAIVVLENVYHHVERHTRHGATRLDKAVVWRAIVDGTGEVMWPVVSSSATTAAAFLPLLLMTGVTGAFFAIIPKTVTVVLVASLIECLLILPVHYLEWGPRTRRRRGTASHTDATAASAAPSDADIAGVANAGAVTRSASRCRAAATSAYDRLLTMTLRHRYVAFLPLLALGFLSYCVLPLINVELFPSEFKHCLVDVRVADEASVDQTAAVAEPIERIALGLGSDRVPALLTWFGALITEDNDVILRNNVAQIHVQLGSGDAAADSTVVAAELRERIGAYLRTHPGHGVASYRVWAPQSGPPIGKPVSIRIECADFRTAKAFAERYKAYLRNIDGVYGIRDDLDFGRQRVDLRVDEDRASVHGLTFLNLAAVLRTANDGRVVSTFKDTRTGEDLDVRLMLDEPYRRKLADLLDLDVPAARGYTVQIGEVADVSMTQGYGGIPHYNGRRVVTVSADVDTTTTTADAVNASVARAFADDVAATTNVRVVYGGEYAETLATFASLQRAYVIALIVIYLLLATQFRSYLQPLVIISMVPFACIGVIAGLLIGGYPFTTMTFIAIVGMSGVVVNDSILLVDRINHEVAAGRALPDALRTAAFRRARPILMTTVTTVVGLAPLALGLGGRSKIWSPFASSFAWGLAFSTVITMLYIPAVYHIIKDLTQAGATDGKPARAAAPRRATRSDDGDATGREPA
ncbi:MAG: efflux RND transporter permease subunit [Phycisphaerae bacterium]